MFLVIGLGNPGEQYQHTPHNLGFWVLDEFQKKNKFPDFKIEKKLESKVSEGKLRKEKVLLVKPQTFMNSSGRAVKKIVETSNCPPEKMFVIHDDLDLSLGRIKLCFDKGAAGHKGVNSIIENLQDQRFYRLRIGIKGVGLNNKNHQLKRKDVVLKKFTQSEYKIMRKAVSQACIVLGVALQQSPERAMTKFNRN